MKAIKNTASKHMFLLIAILISLYFGVHGFYFLRDKWAWPVGLAVSTIVLIELIWLNVFRPKTYAKGINLIAGVVAMTFCVFLPFLSSLSDYQRLERKATVAVQIEQPEYYEDKVIPALEDELKALEERIAPRVALRDRMLEIGSGIVRTKTLEDGTVREYTGYEIASWIPARSEKADFKRVETLKNQIRQYRESDLKARNKFKQKQIAQTAQIAGLNADVDNGRLSFGFKGVLIIALGLFSLYYMYSWANQTPEPKPKKPEITKKIHTDKDFVIDKFPDAFITGIGKEIQVKNKDGDVLGRAKRGDVAGAWKDAKQNIAKLKLAKGA